MANYIDDISGMKWSTMVNGKPETVRKYIEMCHGNGNGENTTAITVHIVLILSISLYAFPIVTLNIVRQSSEPFSAFADKIAIKGVLLRSRI